MNERKSEGMKECMHDMHEKARKEGQRSKDDARSEARRDITSGSSKTVQERRVYELLKTLATPQCDFFLSTFCLCFARSSSAGRRCFSRSRCACFALEGTAAVLNTSHTS